MQKKYSVDIEVPYLVSTKNGFRAKTIKRLGQYDKICSEALSSFKLNGVSFNFFVQWNSSFSNGQLINEVWIKRNISFNNISNVTDKIISHSDIVQKLQQLEGKNTMIRDAKLFSQLGIKLKYLLLLPIDYGNAKPDTIIAYFLRLDIANNNLIYRHVSLRQMKNIIQNNTGQTFKMGKRLYYAESQLEAYLSNTDTPFPGDCDELVYDPVNMKVKFILEYKKCTTRDKSYVKDQSYKRFIKKDKLKYQRLNILRKYIEEIQHQKIPLYNVIYSVNENDLDIKIEEINEELMLNRSHVFLAESTPRENKIKLLNEINNLI